MLFAGFNVHEGEYPLWAAVVVGYGGEPRRLVDRLRDRLLRPRRAAREARASSCTSSPRTSRGPTAGSSATARRPSSSAACCRSSARSSRCRPASRGCRSGGSACTRSLGCLPWVFALAFAGQQAAENWTRWKDSLHYVDYAVAVLIVARRRLPRRSLVAQPQPRARRGCAGLAGRSNCATRSRSGRSTGPPSCCPISSSAHTTLVPWLLGWPYAELDPRAAQGLRGRAARRHGGGAARRPARRGVGRRARPRPPPRAADRWARSCRPPSSATRSSARSSGAWAPRARSRRACCSARRRMAAADRSGRRGRAPRGGGLRRRAGARPRPGVRADPRGRRATA